MELKGALAEGVLPGVLRDVYLGRRTGILHVLHAKDHGSILFIRGHIVHGATTVRECRLGESLVRHGRLSQADLERATEIVLRTRKRLGQVLLDLGLLDQEGLDDALALHVREILLCVFAWSEGSYRFEEQDSAFEGFDKALRLATGEIILDAVWSVSDPDVVRYALGDIDRVLLLSTDPLLRYQRVTLTPTDAFLLSRVDGTLTGREVLAITPAGAGEAQRSLFGLLCIGMVEYQAAPAREEPSPAEASREDVLRAHRKLTTQDHFEVLGLTPEATEADVRSTYGRLARRFHPDIQHKPALADLRGEVEAVFDRISVAHKVLGDPGSRAQYESTLLIARLGPKPDAPAEAAPAAPQANPEESLRKAEEGYRGSQYWDAIQLAEQALPDLKGRPRQRCRVLLAQCYLKNPRWRRMAEEQLLESIQEDEANPEAYYLLGTIYRDGGLAGRAAAMFRRVLELKPRHAEALAELRALPSESPPRDGLLKKIFR